MSLMIRSGFVHWRWLQLFVAVICFATIANTRAVKAEDNDEHSILAKQSPHSLAEELITLKEAVDSLSKRLAESGVDIDSMYANGANYRSQSAMGNTQPPIAPAQDASMAEANMMNSMMSMMSSMMGGMSTSPSMGQQIVGVGNSISSRLPGFPGISHLYHVGATNFFLDHSNHIGLSFEQQRQLSAVRARASQQTASSQRGLQQLEEELWFLTSVDQPDIRQIESKVRMIEKQRGDMRLAFIREVGNAAQVLTSEQRAAIVGKTSASPQVGAQQSGTTSATQMQPGHM